MGKQVLPKSNHFDAHAKRADSAGIDLSSRSALSESHPIMELYRDYFGQLSGTLRKIYGNGPPDPNDIAQQAFEKVIKRGASRGIIPGDPLTVGIVGQMRF